jgi:hypothetical protein
MHPPYVPTATPELEKRVRLLATAGLSDDEIGRAYHLRPGALRKRFGEELKLGRAERKPPSPLNTHQEVWCEPGRSHLAMAAQTAWLRALVRAAPRSAARVNARARQGDNRAKTGEQRFEHRPSGDKDALYDLSDEALMDIIRESEAEKAAHITRDEDET